MPILRNVLKSDPNKGDIKGIKYIKMSNGHLVSSFILRALNCHSNPNFLYNHIIISSINDLPNPLKTIDYLSTELKSIMYQ